MLDGARPFGDMIQPGLGNHNPHGFDNVPQLKQFERSDRVKLRLSILFRVDLYTHPEFEIGNNEFVSVLWRNDNCVGCPALSVRLAGELMCRNFPLHQQFTAVRSVETSNQIHVFL